MDVPHILRSSDIFCFTSDYEGFPNVLLEAMAAGLPVISTNFGGVEELVDHHCNGLIVDLNDAQQAYQALHSYIQNEEMRKTYAKRGRDTILQRFSNESMVRDTLKYYQSVLNDSLE